MWIKCFAEITKTTGLYTVYPNHLTCIQSSQSLPAQGDHEPVLNHQVHTANLLCRKGQSGGLLQVVLLDTENIKNT